MFMLKCVLYTQILFYFYIIYAIEMMNEKRKNAMLGHNHEEAEDNIEINLSSLFSIS